MDHKDALDRDQLIEFVMSCWDDEAGLFCIMLAHVDDLKVDKGDLVHIPTTMRIFTPL
jgi:hypothetical protein